MDQNERIGELEDEIRFLQAHIEDLGRQRENDRSLIAEMAEHVQEADEMIERWVDAFDMERDNNGVWRWPDDIWTRYSALHGEHIDLVLEWNRIVKEYNAVVASKKRNFGRPLAASPAQQQSVLAKHNTGQSLRAIAADTGLGLQTVRTIIDKADGVDRATRVRLEKIAPDKLAEADERRRRKIRNTLPKQITAQLKEGKALLKRAKGLEE
jgi:hypothetical protein